MPGNIITINESKKIRWYVGDSKLDELLLWLEENAIKQQNNTDTNLKKMILLDLWISKLIFPSDVSDFIQIIKTFKTPDEEVKEFCFYTEEHRYRVYAIDRKKDEGYLGCTVTTRKMRTGETWVRGNDLPDGPFLKSTWNNILDRIVSYELVKLETKINPPNIILD